MRTNSGIILQGQQPNFLNTLAQSALAARGVADAHHEADYRNAMREHGPGIAQGNQNSLNALAQFDPGAAVGIQAQRLGMDQTRLAMEATRHRMRIMDEQNARAVAAHASQMSQAEQAQELDNLRRAYVAAQGAQSPEEYDAILSQMGADDLVGTFGQRDAVIAMIADSGTIMEAIMQQGGGFDPDRYRNVDGTLYDLNPAAGGEAPVALNPGSGAPAMDDEMDFAGAYERLPLVRAFNEQSQAYGRIVASAENPSPAGDLAMIFNYMKVLDPGSVVRESEFATAAQASAWLQEQEGIGVAIPRPVAQAIRALQSGERLSDEQRADFTNRATALYRQAERGYSNVYDQWSNRANRYGMTPEDVMTDYRFRPAGALPSAPVSGPQARPVPPAPPVQDSMTVEQVQAMTPDQASAFIDGATDEELNALPEDVAQALMEALRDD